MQLIYKRDKTKDDISQLLKQHKNLVYYMLSKTNQLNNQDAESAAWDALWKSIELYNVYSQVAFSTYACTVMRNAICDVIRKQQRIISICDIDETQETGCLHVEQNVCSSEGVCEIMQIFETYVSSKKGLNRNILLAWSSVRFENNVSNIAQICNTSTSYVSRVQCAFRAYLSRHLK